MTAISKLTKTDTCMQRSSLRIGHKVFIPGLASSLSTLLLLPLLVYLGFWQLDRFEFKKQLQTQQVRQAQLPTLTLETLTESEWSQSHYRKVETRGRFLNEHTILIDNQIQDKRVGYHVITAFQPHNDQRLLLVNRGWIERDSAHAILPNIKPIQADHIAGSITQPVRTLQLQATISSTAWPTRVPFIDFAQLSTTTHASFYPFILQLDAEDPLGFTPISTPHPISANKHLGYAIQWFMMALAVLIYYCVINLKDPCE